MLYFCFFFNDTATTEIYTLSLHDALPICEDDVEDVGVGEADRPQLVDVGLGDGGRVADDLGRERDDRALGVGEDRKSTRLNSSHANISYAVFCLKKKKKK